MYIISELGGEFQNCHNDHLGYDVRSNPQPRTQLHLVKIPTLGIISQSKVHHPDQRCSVFKIRTPLKIPTIVNRMILEPKSPD